VVNGGSFVFIVPSRCATDTHDFNADDESDIVWRDASGNVAVWFMNGAQAQYAGVGDLPTAWTIVGQRDFSSDSKSDILWQNTTSGDVAVWFMNGAQAPQFADTAREPDQPAESEDARGHLTICTSGD
jgi:hypothetical protein